MDRIRWARALWETEAALVVGLLLSEVELSGPVAGVPPSVVPTPRAEHVAEDVKDAEKVQEPVQSRTNDDPGDEAGKLRLVEELKSRAKSAFQHEDMASAELLYGKAITLLGTDPVRQEAVLFSNRAMARLNQSKVQEALADCEWCIVLDPCNVKAWHRKAQALRRPRLPERFSSPRRRRRRQRQPRTTPSRPSWFRRPSRPCWPLPRPWWPSLGVRPGRL